MQIEQDQVEQPGPLDQSLFEAAPFVRRDDERHHVELPGTIDALGIAVDVVGDAVFADRAPRVVAPRGEFHRSHRLDAVHESLALRAERAGAGEHLVEDAGDRLVLLEEPPGKRRSRRQRAVGDRAHRKPRTCRSATPGASGRRRSSSQRKVRMPLLRGYGHRSLRVAEVLEPREPAALRFVRVDRKGLEAAPARMGDVIGAAAKRALVPRVDEIEDQRGVHRDGGVQAARRLPCAVADAGHELAGRARRVQRNRAAVAGEEVPRFRHSGNLDLQPLDRRVHVSDGAAGARLFPEHVPRLERLAQFHMNAAPRHRTVDGKAELQVRREPLQLHRIPAAVRDRRRRRRDRRRRSAAA